MELVEKTIDGENYKIGYFPAGQSVDELTGLLDIFGLSIGKLVEIVNKLPKDFLDADISNLTESLDMGPVGEAFGILCSRLNEKKVSNVIKRFMAQVMHEKSGVVADCFDEHFKGRLFHMFKVFIAALGVQYSDFFGAIGGAQGFAEKIHTILAKQTSQAGAGS